MSLIKNHNINELKNIVNDNVLVICINYIKDEFKNIKKENYLNANKYNLLMLKNMIDLFLILNSAMKMSKTQLE